MMKRGVFLDRDGTINIEKGYLKDFDSLNIYPEAVEAIKLINKNKMRAIVVTNQAGVARGYFNEGVVKKINRRLKELLKEKGAHLDGMYYCPHHPEVGPPQYRKNCRCRKPGPEMLERASQKFGIDLRSSYVIGDKIIDIELADSVGGKGILVLTGYGQEEEKQLHEGFKVQPYYIARNVLDAVNWILLDVNKKE